jgi:large subunit ribosomal protein L25
MTEILSITAEKRGTHNADNRTLEQSGYVLASLYGHGVDPVAVKVNASDMLRLYRKTGKSKLFTLELDSKKISVIVKELKVHPVRHQIQHVDFFAVDEKRTVTVPVPFEFVGISPAVKNYGGVLTVSHKSVRIQCLPNQIPASITVDISGTKEMGSVIKLADLDIDPILQVRKMDQGAIICSVSGRKSKTVEGEEGVEASAA